MGGSLAVSQLSEAVNQLPALVTARAWCAVERYGLHRQPKFPRPREPMDLAKNQSLLNRPSSSASASSNAEVSQCVGEKHSRRAEKHRNEPNRLEAQSAETEMGIRVTPIGSNPSTRHQEAPFLRRRIEVLEVALVSGLRRERRQTVLLDNVIAHQERIPGVANQRVSFRARRLQKNFHGLTDRIRRRRARQFFLRLRRMRRVDFDANHTRPQVQIAKDFVVQPVNIHAQEVQDGRKSRFFNY